MTVKLQYGRTKYYYDIKMIYHSTAQKFRVSEVFLKKLILLFIKDKKKSHEK